MLFKNGESFEVFKNYTEISFKQTLLIALEKKDYASLISFTGLITLISLPLLRIFFTIILFLKQKEFILSMLALSVFLALIASFFLGLEL